MGKLIEERMPERVRQVDFTENARIPTGLTRAVQSSEVRIIFLEKGCVVVRELVVEEGRRVVKSVALPLNSGLVRSLILEDEEAVGEEPATGEHLFEDGGWVPAALSASVHPGGLTSTATSPTFAEALAAQSARAPDPTPEERLGSADQRSDTHVPSEPEQLAGSETAPVTAEEAILNGPRRPRRR